MREGARLSWLELRDVVASYWIYAISRIILARPWIRCMNCSLKALLPFLETVSLGVKKEALKQFWYFESTYFPSLGIKSLGLYTPGPGESDPGRVAPTLKLVSTDWCFRAHCELVASGPNSTPLAVVLPRSRYLRVSSGCFSEIHAVITLSWRPEAKASASSGLSFKRTVDVIRIRWGISGWVRPVSYFCSRTWFSFQCRRKWCVYEE